MHKVIELVKKKIKKVPNRQGEYKRKIHYCCYLLCYKSGLRISEAIKFDLTNKTKSDLYRIEKPKGKKERFVYVSKEVISELKKNNWKPNQTNRFTFYWFLRKIKREINIDKKIELTPHTLRRSFTTYYAEAGMPLPLLQKWLGHESTRTTILYWKNPYEKPFAGKIPIGDNDIDDILAAKKWLEDKKEPPKLPIRENFPQVPKNPEPIFLNKNPTTSNQKPIQQDNSLLVSGKRENKTAITNYQPKSVISKVPAKQKFSLKITNKSKEISEQSLPITNESKKEQILLAKIKQLEEQLKQTQDKTKLLETQNNNLTAKLTQTAKEKTKLELTATQEKNRADNYHQQLKTIAKTLHQLQKTNYYKQLEQERKEQEAKIEQPPWKLNK